MFIDQRPPNDWRSRYAGKFTAGKPYCDICLEGEYFCDCWMCSHCETSNAIDNDLCSICGTSQSKSVSIQAWPMYVKWESAGGIYELIENGAYGSIFPEWPILYLHLDDAQKNAYKPNDNDFAIAEKAWELYHNLYTPEGIPVLNPRSSTVRLNPSGQSAESFSADDGWKDDECAECGTPMKYKIHTMIEFEGGEGCDTCGVAVCHNCFHDCSGAESFSAESKVYQIPCHWSVSMTIPVEAESLDEACEKAYTEIEKHDMSKADYLEDSFEPDYWFAHDLNEEDEE